MEKSAELSPCGNFRYALGRKWSDGPCVLFVMLNPSTADAYEDDRTISRCIAFAKSWDFGSLAVGNLFAFRTPSPSALKLAESPIGEDNELWLRKLQKSANLTIAAWGNDGKFNGRSAEVARILVDPHILRLTKLGEPGHPLYIKADTRYISWSRNQ